MAKRKSDHDCLLLPSRTPPTSGPRISRRSAIKSGIALGAGITAASIIGSKASAQSTMLRFGSDSPIGAPHTASAIALKNEIEAKTSGRIQVVIFPDSQLGTNQVMLNSVKAGTLDGMVTDAAVVSAGVPGVDVFNLPFLFKDTAHALRAANGAVGAKLKPAIDEAFACEVLGWATDGARNMFNGKHPIKTPADLQGLKMRVQPSKIQRDTYLAFGALPTPVAFAEVYTALQTGVIDGSDHAVVDMLELKLYQVTKYLTLTRQFSIIGLLVVSQKLMSRLTPADQDIVRAAGKLAAAAQVKAVLDNESKALDELKSHGLQVIEPDDKKAFADKVQSVYTDNADRVPPDMIQLVKSLA
jgi:tripartite ATP-independent transporter DctP family solute receptor